MMQAKRKPLPVTHCTTFEGIALDWHVRESHDEFGVDYECTLLTPDTFTDAEYQQAEDALVDELQCGAL